MSDSPTDCIFCKIVSGELGTEFVAESAHAVAFNDIAPHAPTHVLIVPRRHIPSLADLTENDAELLGEMISLANQVARERGIDASGYRLVTNVGKDGGQEVPHLHWHLLGGRALKFRP
ncbi:MAG: histidine triad nucleotide-binding protein [Thermomicrobiales bacterium]